jgi:8-oxo-dGTP pyrophosphatase MutT (NUDIX family)
MTDQNVQLDLSPSAVHTPSASGVVGGYGFDETARPEVAAIVNRRVEDLATKPVPAPAVPAALAVVMDPQGRILTVSRPEPPHEMSIPGGHVDPGESPAQAAVRELLEETGVTCDLATGWRGVGPKVDLLFEMASPADGRVVSVFRIHDWWGMPRPLEGGHRVAWMTLKELLAQAVIYRPTVEKLMSTLGLFDDVALIDAAKRNALPEGKFALPATRKYPIDTAARTRNAAARLEQAKKTGKVTDAEYKTARAAIAKAAKKFGITSQYNEDDKSAQPLIAPKQRLRAIHVRAELAHGGSLHVRHMSDKRVVLDDAVEVVSLGEGVYRLSDQRPIRQDAEEIDPASVGVTLMGPSTWRDGTPKKLVWVQLAEVGSWKGHPAGPFELTPAIFAEAKRNFEARNLPIQFDMDHCSEEEASAGTLPILGAPAHGWVHRLDNRSIAGLWGLTEWFDYARDGIKSGAFAFLSPAFRFGCRDQVTGKPIGARITSAAITNKPFLTGLEGLRAAHDNGKDARMTDASFDAISGMVSKAIDEAYPPTSVNGVPGGTAWVCDLFDDYAVYNKDGCYWKIGYVYADGNVTLKGEPEKVIRQYATIGASDHRTGTVRCAILNHPARPTAHVMPRLKDALRMHPLSTHEEVSDKLGALREACMHCDDDGMWSGENLHDFMRPLRELVEAPFGATYEDVLDALDEFVDAENEKLGTSSASMDDVDTQGESLMSDTNPGVVALKDAQEKAVKLEGDIRTLSEKVATAETAIKTAETKATTFERENATLQANLNEAKTRADRAEGPLKEIAAALTPEGGARLLKDGETVAQAVARIAGENVAFLKDKHDRDEADLKRDLSVAYDDYKDSRRLDESHRDGWMMSLARLDRAKFNETFPVLTAEQRKLLTNVVPNEARPSPEQPSKSLTGRAREILMKDPSTTWADAYKQAAEELSSKPA